MADEMAGGDIFAYALLAMETITSAIAEQKGVRAGHGQIVCPRCKADGLDNLITYDWSRKKSGSRPLSYGAQCSRVGCIQFTGH